MDYHSKAQMARLEECCAKSEPPSEPSSIAMAISAINMALGRLDDNLGRLTAKMEPACRSQPPAPTQAGGEEAFPVGCKIADELRSVHIKINRMADGAYELIKRVDL